MNKNILIFKRTANIEEGKTIMHTKELYLNPYEKIKQLIDNKESKLFKKLTPNEFSMVGGIKIDNSDVNQNDALTDGYRYEQAIIKKSKEESQD